MQSLIHAGHDANFRNSCVPLPYCRTPQFLAAAFARLRRFRYLVSFRTFGGCASGERDGADSESVRSTLSVNGYQKRRSRPSGPACCFVSGTGGSGDPVGPTPSPRPRRAQQRQHRAALCGAPRQSANRPITDRIRRRRERPEPLRVRRFRFGIGGAAAECPPVCRAGTRRCTGPRTLARPMRSQSCSCAAPTGPSRIASGNAALRRTARPTA
jgi:hypothetical protein